MVMNVLYVAPMIRRLAVSQFAHRRPSQKGGRERERETEGSFDFQGQWSFFDIEIKR